MKGTDGSSFVVPHIQLEVVYLKIEGLGNISHLIEHDLFDHRRHKIPIKSLTKPLHLQIKLLGEAIKYLKNAQGPAEGIALFKGFF